MNIEYIYIYIVYANKIGNSALNQFIRFSSNILLLAVSLKLWIECFASLGDLSL